MELGLVGIVTKVVHSSLSLVIIILAVVVGQSSRNKLGCRILKYVFKHIGLSVLQLAVLVPQVSLDHLLGLVGNHLNTISVVTLTVGSSG